MQIQTNTDKNIDGKDALAAHVEVTVTNALLHLQHQITRVEVHLSDENAGKSGGDDKRCVMEARPINHQPVAVSHQAGSVHQALDGAAKKLKVAVETLLGRLDRHNRHRASLDLEPE